LATVGVIYAFPVANKIKLGDVQVLTLERGGMTTGRRSSPVPQLECVGGTARSHANQVRAIQCHNVGFDGNDYNWKCETQISDDYKLGRTEVNCEGYDYPDDPYVLVGSCGLSYELDYSPQYYNRLNLGHGSDRIITTTTRTYWELTPPDVEVFFIIFFAILLFFALIASMSTTKRR
jgi:hypothetical protein